MKFEEKPLIRAAAFDLGNTLTNNEAFPLNWQGFYRDAITSVLQSVNAAVTPARIQAGESTLMKYNTRINPRDHEVTAETIFTELFHQWQLADLYKIKTAEAAFAAFFMQKSTLYPETIPVLAEFKKRKLKVGILSNIAYGISGEYVFRDTVDLTPYIDVFLTSTEVGFRKPHPKGYHDLIGKLGVTASECIFVGDEEVDIVGANRVGMISVLVNRQNHKLDYGQTYTIHSLNELLEMIT
jgi:putative hydrolase of the HAD superfamily